MHLKLLLPSQIFIDKTDISNIIVETSSGSYGLLPHRLDCVAVLTPGILTFSTIAEGEIFVAVDEGVLVKTGLDVLVSVRNALVDSDLTKLRAAVEQDFLAINEQALQVRAVMAKLESGFLHKFVSFKQQ
ncbi:MAG TPA: F0F1 ATP synthase subunit epsilon [Pseudoalteromonas prydzensis]|uniref:ATP synthase epsilon chain n=2 Tax=Pseudoalteromonas TaxID=53246 RepID=A0A7V1CV77_9GAMM|nr:F0F1 ATP synthase subunit epsilon [Pseudoalteromonas sp. SR44-8]HEA14921.1 F0F1 ATP synthase subunit epsilon [Pseudoalteromonas prydzensis]